MAAYRQQFFLDTCCKSFRHRTGTTWRVEILPGFEGRDTMPAARNLQMQILAPWKFLESVSSHNNVSSTKNCCQMCLLHPLAPVLPRSIPPCLSSSSTGNSPFLLGFAPSVEKRMHTAGKVIKADEDSRIARRATVSFYRHSCES